VEVAEGVASDPAPAPDTPIFEGFLKNNWVVLPSFVHEYFFIVLTLTFPLLGFCSVLLCCVMIGRIKIVLGFGAVNLT